MFGFDHDKWNEWNVTREEWDEWQITHEKGFQLIDEFFTDRMSEVEVPVENGDRACDVVRNEEPHIVEDIHNDTCTSEEVELLEVGYVPPPRKDEPTVRTSVNEEPLTADPSEARNDEQLPQGTPRPWVYGPTLVTNTQVSSTPAGGIAPQAPAASDFITSIVACVNSIGNGPQTSHEQDAGSAADLETGDVSGSCGPITAVQLTQLPRDEVGKTLYPSLPRPRWRPIYLKALCYERGVKLAMYTQPAMCRALLAYDEKAEQERRRSIEARTAFAGRLRRDMPGVDDPLPQDERDDGIVESTAASPTLEVALRHHLAHASTPRNCPGIAAAENSLHLPAVHLPSFAPRASPSAETPCERHGQELDGSPVGTDIGEAGSEDSTGISGTAHHTENDSAATLHDSTGTIDDSTSTLHNSRGTLHSESTTMAGSAESTAVAPPPRPTRGRGRPKESGTRAVRTTRAAMDDAAVAVDDGSAVDQHRDVVAPPEGKKDGCR